MTRIGKTQQKILLLLCAGVTIGLSHDPRTPYRVLRSASRAWKEIDRKFEKQTIDSLYQRKLITAIPHEKGHYTLALTREGYSLTARQKLKTLTIQKPARWDGKWRSVLYDIPVEKNAARLDLLITLKQLGFLEIQKSVFIYPYPITKEIETVARVLEVRDYVRLMLIEEIEDEETLKKYFKL